MKEIQLTQGQVALVDDEDFEWLSKFKWAAQKDRHTYYARRRTKVSEASNTERITMHRAIKGTTDPLVLVDHEDGNGLNNQRHNLRECNRVQSQCNRSKPTNSTTGFKGVTVRYANSEVPYEAKIVVKGVTIRLGRRATPEQAHQLYCDAARKYHGEFCNLGDKWQR